MNVKLLWYVRVPKFSQGYLAYRDSLPCEWQTVGSFTCISNFKKENLKDHMYFAKKNLLV